MAAGLPAPETTPPPAPPEQALEERRFWFGVLPKPRQEVPCACVKDGVPQEFCKECLGTGMHANRDPERLKGAAPERIVLPAPRPPSPKKRRKAKKKEKRS